MEMRLRDHLVKLFKVLILNNVYKECDCTAKLFFFLIIITCSSDDI